MPLAGLRHNHLKLIFPSQVRGRLRFILNNCEVYCDRKVKDIFNCLLFIISLFLRGPIFAVFLLTIPWFLVTMCHNKECQKSGGTKVRPLVNVLGVYQKSAIRLIFCLLMCPSHIVASY